MVSDPLAPRINEMWDQAKKQKPAKMGVVQWRKFRWTVCIYIAQEVRTTPEHVLSIIRHPQG